MRIALLSYEYPPETGFGGIGTYTYYHARALARLGHEVHVFAGSTEPTRSTRRDGNVTVTRFRKVGPVERMVPTADWRGLWWFQNRLQTATSMFAAMREELHDKDFDVVEMPECGGEGAFLNHLFDLPTVVRFHSPAELIMPTYGIRQLDQVFTSAVERFGIAGARALTSCSHWLAEEVRTKMGIERPIAVIPNGIDLALFDQDEAIDIHAKLGVPKDRVTVFFANRLEPRKGIHVVRDMMVDTLQKHRDVCFVLAGADPYDIIEKEMRPMLREHGLEDGLCYVGKLDLPTVRACLKQTDVFLLTSTWENAPYSLLEAMSAGKAIVASDCGGVPEMLRHEIDGLIARTNDADSFRRALGRMLKQESLRRRFGQSARQRIEARFTDEHVAQRSVDFYQWALDAPGGVLFPSAAPDSGPVLEVDSTNWFQTWWMRGASSGERPILGKAEDTGLATASLAQLTFVHGVLARTYWEGNGRTETPEAAFLDSLEALIRARASDDAAPGDRPLSLPALTHPVFGDEVNAARFLAELWRLEGDPAVTEWLLRETTTSGFADRASRRVSWRRLAIEACRRRPEPTTYDTLHQIYRTVAHHAIAVQKDREFIESDPNGAELQTAVDALGLHAPLQRPAVFKKSRKRRKTTASDALVTVLIPSYKHEAYIAETIESVLNQTHENVRVLVVDDRSPDDTVAVARGIDDPRVEVFVNETNLGLGGSVVAALDRIETPIVALLNSDDEFHPDRIDRCLARLEDDPDCDLVATRVAVMDGKGKRLTVDHVCAVDHGPQVFDWVHWYDGVVSALDEDAHWTSVAWLLRHNHLATSSNIVCRTEFLRRHQAGLPDLKYCLDWSLFLAAGVERKLAVLPEELLAYRMHDANTVWFEDGGRDDYIHEANWVVARALQDFAAMRRDADTADAVLAEELAELLLDHVRHHGETEGRALILAMLAGRFGAGGEACARLAASAVRSKQLLDALEDVAGEPWRVAEVARDAERAKANAIGAEFQARHARSLESLAAERPRETHDLGANQELRERMTGIRDECDEIVRKAREVVAERDDTLADRDARIESLESELSQTRDQLHWTTAERDTFRRELDDNLKWARRAELESYHQIQRLQESHEWRTGRMVLHKLKLHGLFKTILRLHAQRTVRRDRRRARRLGQGDGPRSVLFCTGRFPAADAGRLAAEAQVLRAAGTDARLICFERGPQDSLTEAEQTLLPRRSLVVGDAALSRRDRDRFAANNAAGVQRVSEHLGDDQDAQWPFVAAASAQAHDPSVLVASGLGTGLLATWASSVLLDKPFGVTITRLDLGELAETPKHLLTDAGWIWTDSDATRDAVDAHLEDSAPAMLVAPPPVFASPEDRSTETGLFALIGPTREPDALLTLAEAMHVAVEQGADVRLGVIGDKILDAENLQAFEWFRGRLVELGLLDRVRFLGEPHPSTVLDLLGRAQALIEPRGASHDGCLSRSVVTAMALARPVLASAAQLGDAVRDGQEGLLLAKGDIEGLARAMVQLTEDPGRARELGGAARGRFEALFTAERTAHQLRERIAGTIDS